MEKTLVVKKETGAICQVPSHKVQALIDSGNYELKSESIDIEITGSIVDAEAFAEELKPNGN